MVLLLGEIMEKLELKKGGFLIETRWVSPSENNGEGKYIDVDVTNQGIRKLFEVCRLEDGFLLKDLFVFLNRELEVYDAIFGNWLKEIVQEGLKDPTEGKTFNIYDPEEIEYLELYYSVYCKEKCKKYPAEFGGFHRPNFGGVGFELKEDKLENGYLTYKKGERIPWGVSFTPINDLTPLSLKLSENFNIYNENFGIKDPNYGNLIVSYEGANYTLASIILGVVWELSFHGSPESSKEFGKSLKQMVSDIKNKKD